jgi:hypothetical protein
MNDNEDFLDFLSEYNLTWELVRKVSENLEDQISIQEENDNFQIRVSKIEGLGVFTKVNLFNGFYIGKARMSGKRTLLGRYTNHSMNANAKMVMLDDDVGLFCIKDILKDQEITVNYRQVAKNIQRMEPVKCHG